MAGGGTKTDTQTKNEPWAGAQPYLTDMMGKAKGLYDANAGGNPYSGPVVADLDPTLRAAMTGITNRAGFGDAGRPWDYAMGMMGNQGMSGQMGGALDTLGKIGSGDANFGGVARGVMSTIAQGNPVGTMGLYGDLANRAGNTNSDVIGGLGQIAMGQSMPGTGQLQDLYGTSRGQNEGSIQALSNPGQIGTGGAYGDVANQAFGQAPGMSRLPQINTGRGYGELGRGVSAFSPGALGSLANTGGVTTAGAYSHLADRAGGTTAADQNLGDMASGAEADNPHLQQMLEANDRRIADRVNSSMSGMGRYGSAGHTDVLGRSLAEADAPILGQAYESARQRQLAATGQIDASRQAANSAALGALGGMTGAQQAGAGIQIGAASQMDAAQRAAEQNKLSALAGQTGVQDQNINHLLAGRGLGLQSQQLGLSALGGQTGVQGQNISNAMSGAGQAAGIRQGDLSQAGGLLGQIANAENAGVGNRISAGNSMAGLRNQNLSTQLSALGGMTGAQGQNAGMQLQAASGLGSIENQNLQNRMGAANSALGAYGQGLDRSNQLAALAPQLNQLSYDPYQQLAQVGNFQQGRAQQQLQGNIDLYNQRQAMPWTQLGRYSQGIAGLAGLIPQMGQTNTNQNQQQQPGWNQWAGLGIAGLGLLCDRGRKVDIETLGVDPETGLMLYAFRYAADPKTYPKVVGPMADEVARMYPHAVRQVGGTSIIIGEVN